MRAFVAIYVVALLLSFSNAGAEGVNRPHFDFQEVMIPMRDGVRLQTVIVFPQSARKSLPIVLRRTPYGVPSREAIEKNGLVPFRSEFESRISVFQNLRGRFKSEGKFVMQRPPHRADDAKGTDETTDAWDTVEWLVHNIAKSNGRVGLEGTSYDAWTAVMAALDPHPAVKAIVERASPADMFLGDDFHHNGTFRLSYGFEYSALLETTGQENFHFKFHRADTYEWYLNLGPLRNADEQYFHGAIPTWRDFVEHPDNDEFWRRQTVISYIKDVKVPILHVAGWWDQEDFYGPQKIYEAMEKYDRKHWNYFVAGPWNHGQWEGKGSHLGPLGFGSDTAKYYQEKIEDVWFAYWLRDQGHLPLAEATAFETGSNRWIRYEAWPPTNKVHPRRLYFQPGRKLAFETSTLQGGETFDEYVSDPASPVPYRPRPVTPTYPGPEWPLWLVQDQRFVDHRPDVLSLTTDTLTADLHIAGDIVAELFAATSGTDSDWVVKLIDVYPEDAPADKETKTPMGGYQLIIADEILRARFRDSFERPEPVVPNEPIKYRIDLHSSDHVFLKGHRIIVQVQSSWFPVYDRNPQQFVPNIFKASAADYHVATQKVYHSADLPSDIVLPVADEP